MICLLIEIDSKDIISVEVFLMQNHVPHKMYHNLWQGYFKSITELAMERIIEINNLEELEDEQHQKIVNKVAKCLDEDENNFLYLLLKAEGLIEKEIIK